MHSFYEGKLIADRPVGATRFLNIVSKIPEQDTSVNRLASSRGRRQSSKQANSCQLTKRKDST